ncbi:endonuclease NucS [Candidatus Woesearchaeota archaeon]|nr:endonuclease NucS [Candidatus Woesearchaeota archaeon]
MDLNLFRLDVEKALAGNETISFFCRCKVKYSGRAEAELGDGDRLIVIKADNSILVHQPEGSSPINYMKNESSVVFDENEQGILVLSSYNSKFKDYLDIEILRVYSLQHMKLEDGKKLVLVGSEKDMSDMIKEHPDLIGRDFKPLSREEHTKFGFIDVFGHDNKGNLVVVECKRYTAGLSAIQQLRRYVEKIVELKGIKSDCVKGVIAAPEIAPNAKEMLEKWGFSFCAVNPPKRLERFNKDQKSLVDF